MEPAVTSPPHHAGHYHGSNGTPGCIVLHDEEYPLSDSSAEVIARDVFSKANAGGCAQYVIDADSEQHPCAEVDLSWNAPPNFETIGFERDGYASWDLAHWHKPKAQMTTCRVAARVAEVAVRRRIPITWLEVATLKAKGKGARGITSHRNRSAAFKMSDHTDPGPFFPIAEFMALVRTAYAWFKNSDAVSQFQEAQKITVDGVVGKETIDAAAKALYGSGMPAPVQPVPAPMPNPTKPDQPTWGPEPKSGYPLTIWQYGPRTTKVQTRLGIGNDGYFGQDTRAAVIQFQRAHGLPATGAVNQATWNAMFPARPKPATRPSFPHLRVDGIPGRETLKALGIACGSKRPSGKFNLATRRALQRHLGVRDDGVIGNITIRAWQHHVGAPVDGVLGEQTWRKTQQALRDGRF